MNLKSHKVFIAWITVVIYTMSACAFISTGHCCSGHCHLDGEAQEDNDHMPVELSGFASAPNEFSLSQRHCCGQGLHGGNEKIALHAVNCQRSIEASRLAAWLSWYAALSHEQPDFAYVLAREGWPLSRAPARSPALVSILTVSLLI